MNKVIADILNNANAEEALSIEGVLARNFRQTLMTMNINEEKWAELMEKFVEAQNLPDEKAKISLRGNLTVEFARAEMSWKVYCAALAFLGVKKAVLCMTPEFEDGKQVAVETAFVFK